ncbi:MAG: phosphoribosylglycinamide synthetase C domain-containing protein, partial [bacterium]
KYGLAKELLQPLLPWFRETNYCGPVQVTAAMHNGKWHVLEYNIRLGVTCGAMVLRLLEKPIENLWEVVNNRQPDIRFNSDALFGCSLTLAGIGYPFVAVTGPPLPIRVSEPFDCDVWWNEVAVDDNDEMIMTGHRLADVVAFGRTLDEAISSAYKNIKKIHCVSSYYRTDIGQSLWPPGNT